MSAEHINTSRWSHAPADFKTPVLNQYEFKETPGPKHKYNLKVCPEKNHCFKYRGVTV